MKKWDCLRLLQISLVLDLIEDCRGFISASVSSLLPNKVSCSTPVKWRRQQHPSVMKIVLISWTLWKGLGCAGKQALQKGKKKSPEPKVYTNVSFYGISSHHRQLQVTSLTPLVLKLGRDTQSMQATDVPFWEPLVQSVYGKTQKDQWDVSKRLITQWLENRELF